MGANRRKTRERTAKENMEENIPEGPGAWWCHLGGMCFRSWRPVTLETTDSLLPHGRNLYRVYTMTRVTRKHVSWTSNMYPETYRRKHVAGYKLLVRDTCCLYLVDITIHLCHGRLVSLCIQQQTGDDFVKEWFVIDRSWIYATRGAGF